jgi:hypothetical protein
VDILRRRKKVSFTAKVPSQRRARVSFKSKGKKVSFLAKKDVEKKVSFYAKKKK